MNKIIFPYSPDFDTRKQEVWNNLKEGILLEDSNVFIPWSTKFSELTEFSEANYESGGRDYWELGEHNIINGLAIPITVVKFSGYPVNLTFDQISSELGFDDTGETNFLNYINHITGLLGEPTELNLEVFNNRKIGKANWINGQVQISLFGFEHFNCRYGLQIGLIDTSSNRFHNNLIEQMKNEGWTEEDFGK